MASVTKTYFVVSPLPVVVDDAGSAVSYQPGAVFTALNTNPSIVRLLADEKIVETTGTTEQGFAVIQGQQGPVGPVGPTGPAGPPGGLPAALAIDNTTSGLDLEVTDADAIVGQSDGGWDLGSPDGGSTLRRPATVFVQTEVDLTGTTLSSSALTGAAALLVTSGADTNLTLRGADATPTSGNDGGTVIVQAGAKDGAGVEGKIELRGNFPNALVADVDGALNLYDASANKVIEVLADPGALRVGRNTQLTIGEGDFVFGNDGTLTGTPTGLLLWDATVQQLELRDNSNNRTIEIDGGVPEVALFEAAGDRAVYFAATGSQLMLRAEHAANRPSTDAVFDILVKGGDAAGTEDGSDITLDAGRALGTGGDGQIALRTGNMDRWFIDPNGYLLAAADNGYNIGAVGANRPLRVYVGTEVVVGNTVTIGTDTITASGVLNLSIASNLNATAPASTTGPGSPWSWTMQAGEGGTAGVAPVAGSVGGSWLVVGGTGGAAQGTGTGGETGGDAGIGGLVRLTAGAGGAGQDGAVDPGQPGVGGSLELLGGPGGAGAGASDNANGGNVVIRGGSAGTGGAGPAASDGNVVIGDATTNSVTCGSLSVTNTQLIGSITTVNGGVSIAFETGGGGKWDIPTAGHFLAATDNVYDIGASGATRPRTGYFGTSVVVGNTLTMDTGSIYAADGVGGVGGDFFMFAGQGDTGFRSGRVFICAYESKDVLGQSVAVEGGQVRNTGATDLRAGAGQFMGGTGFNSGATGEVRGGHALIRGGLGLHNTVGLAQGGSVYIEAGYGVDEDGSTNKRNPGSINIGLGATEASLNSDLQFWNGDTLVPSAVNIGGASATIGFFGTTAAAQQADTVALTDNSGGTADNTVQALTDPADTPVDADALRDDLVANLIPELRNNLADLTAKYNALRDLLRAYGLMA